MPGLSRHFLFLLASTRFHGNSELLARRAAEHLPAAAGQQWLRLLDLPLPEFIDLRHDTPYPAPEGNARLLLDATLAATDLVLVTPLYWYSMSVLAKRYFDYWSDWLRQPAADFRAAMAGKTLWAVVASSGSAEEAEPLARTLQLSAINTEKPPQPALRGLFCVYGLTWPACGYRCGRRPGRPGQVCW